jgi:peptidoglycan/LPS O-acetylase OafA/YrhL
MEGRLPGIQVGRAIAAASVFYFHSYMTLGYFDQGRLHTFGWLAAHGASGVDLFFTISGFIVCYVAARPSFTPLSFLTKRFFRIYPLNVAVTLLIVGAVLWGAGGIDEITSDRLIRSLLILPQRVPINSAGWTLEYEVAFYLIAALVLPRGGPWLLFGYCIASVFLSREFDAQDHYILARFLTGQHASFGGGILAYIILKHIPTPSKGAAWLASLVLPIAGLVIFQFRFGLTFATPIACTVAVIGLALLPWAPSALVTFGDSSYGFYLLHWPMVVLGNWLIFKHVRPSPLIGELWRWNVFLYVCVLAHLSWIYFERPINTWAAGMVARLRTRSDANRYEAKQTYAASSAASKVG